MPKLGPGIRGRVGNSHGPTGPGQHEGVGGIERYAADDPQVVSGAVDFAHLVGVQGIGRHLDRECVPHRDHDTGVGPAEEHETLENLGIARGDLEEGGKLSGHHGIWSSRGRFDHLVRLQRGLAVKEIDAGGGGGGVGIDHAPEFEKGVDGAG